MANRLMYNVAIVDDQGIAKYPIEKYGIAWHLLTLQDAIDFALYLERATVETHKFFLRSRSVGGPIDVLVLKPDGAIEWIQENRLRGEAPSVQT